ncbi:MAG: helix-turn-helix transcriptional regulator [Microscillaceae bacterium]|nr:helix-turn-helix transcriptional regulator [Microscillaceae bacterium]
MTTKKIKISSKMEASKYGDNEHKELESQIRKKIKQVRTEKKISMKKMAEMLGIGTTTYAQMENGDSPFPLDRFLYVAKILEIDDIILNKQSDENVQIVVSPENIANYFTHLINSSSKHSQDIQDMKNQLNDIEEILRKLLEQQAKEKSE